jgi:hypothetical protein
MSAGKMWALAFGAMAIAVAVVVVITVVIPAMSTFGQLSEHLR